jgi:hypothetical protein
MLSQLRKIMHSMSVMRYALNQHEILDGLSANRNYPETGLAEMSGDFLEADFVLPIWQVTRRGPNRVAT